MSNVDLPGDIILDENTNLDELPELPEGYVWGFKVTADAEVIKADGTKQED